jgi:hypothetical protein
VFDRSVPERFTREMAVTLQDFARTLPAVAGGHDCHLEGRSARIGHPGGEILITLHPTTERRLGSFVIPATPVEFRFVGLEEEERRDFMRRFDRHFQRGGG